MSPASSISTGRTGRRPATPLSPRVGLRGPCFAVLCLAGIAAPLGAQPEPAEAPEASQPEIEPGVDYRVYDRNGRPTSIRAIVTASLGEEVLLIGEEHDDMVGHAFETELFQAVLDGVGGSSLSGRPVVLSLEMFERDVQYVLDEYLEGLISEAHFLRSARPWDYYELRYRPLVEAARAVGAPVVAANAPRRYVNRVSAEGPFALERLSGLARSYLPPLPYPGPSRDYRAQWDALMGEVMSSMAEDEPADSTTRHSPEEARDSVEDGDGSDPRSYATNPHVIQAQALWDAAMGHAITQALVRHVGGFVVHVAGSFHVERGTGIPERIADYRPGTRVVTVVMTKVDDIDGWSAEEHGPLADYVVLTRKPSAGERVGG